MISSPGSCHVYVRYLAAASTAKRVRTRILLVGGIAAPKGLPGFTKVCQTPPPSRPVIHNRPNFNFTMRQHRDVIQLSNLRYPSNSTVVVLVGKGCVSYGTRPRPYLVLQRTALNTVRLDIAVVTQSHRPTCLWEYSVSTQRNLTPMTGSSSSSLSREKMRLLHRTTLNGSLHSVVCHPT